MIDRLVAARGDPQCRALKINCWIQMWFCFPIGPDNVLNVRVYCGMAIEEEESSNTREEYRSITEVVVK